MCDLLGEHLATDPTAVRDTLRETELAAGGAGPVRRPDHARPGAGARRRRPARPGARPARPGARRFRGPGLGRKPARRVPAGRRRAAAAQGSPGAAPRTPCPGSADGPGRPAGGLAPDAPGRGPGSRRRHGLDRSGPRPPPRPAGRHRHAGCGLAAAGPDHTADRGHGACVRAVAGLHLQPDRRPAVGRRRIPDRARAGDERRWTGCSGAAGAPGA